MRRFAGTGAWSGGDDCTKAESEIRQNAGDGRSSACAPKGVCTVGTYGRVGLGTLEPAGLYICNTLAACNVQQ